MKGLISRLISTAWIQDAAITLAKLATASVDALSGLKLHVINIGQYDSTALLVWDDYVSTSLRWYWDPAEWENVTAIKIEAVLGGWGGNTATVAEMYDHTNGNDLDDAASIISAAPTARARSSGDIRDDPNFPGAAAEMRFKFRATTAGTAAIQTLRVLIVTDD